LYNFNSEQSASISGGGAVQRGPDDKIYIASNGGTFVNVIDDPNPDTPGFTVGSVSLSPNACTLGLPVVPQIPLEIKDYRVHSGGTWYSVCNGDTIRFYDADTSSWKELAEGDRYWNENLGIWEDITCSLPSPPIPQTPQGTVSIANITLTDDTAVITFTYDNSDQDGFKYRLDGGSPVTISGSPINLTGLTGGTTYSIEIYAYNAAGDGNSTTDNFTTLTAYAINSFFQPETRGYDPPFNSSGFTGAYTTLGAPINVNDQVLIEGPLYSGYYAVVAAQDVFPFREVVFQVTYQGSNTTSKFLA
jgi:hypothetical protein